MHAQPFIELANMPEDAILTTIKEELDIVAGAGFCGTISLAVVRDLEEQEYLLTGFDEKYKIQGGSNVAVLYGVYNLMEAMGFRMFSPDKWDFEEPAQLQCPPLDIQWKPPIEYRGFFVVEARETPAMMRWMAWHKLNLWGAKFHDNTLPARYGIRQRGNSINGTHRVFADFLPPEKYYETHPEYFALINGVRSKDVYKGDGDNFCTTNIEACKELAKNFAEELEHGSLKNVDLINFASFDNGHWCQCPECAKAGNCTTRLLNVAYWVDKAIKERVSRRVVLVVPAYHETLEPPDMPLPPDFDYSSVMIQFFPIERCYAHNFDDESCIANATLNRRYRAWADFGKFRIIAGEYYGVSSFTSMAFILDESMAHDIPYYIRNSASGIDYMHVSTALWGELALNNCAFAACLNGQTFDANEFYIQRYRKAAPAMERFYGCLRRATANCKCLKHYQGIGYNHETQRPSNYSFKSRLGYGSKTDELFLPGHFELDKDYGKAVSFNTTLALLDKANEHLKEAVSLAENDAVLQKRLEIDRRRFDYTCKQIHFLDAFLQLRLAERAENAAKAKKAAERLHCIGEELRNETEMVAHVRENGAPNLSLYTNGLTAIQCETFYNQIMQQYGFVK